MTVTLLVNPASARGRDPAVVDGVASRVAAVQGPPAVVRSGSLAEVTDVVAAAARDDVVVVLGGDGTLNAAALGAARSGALVVPLPGGSGNDLCRHLGIPLDPLRAAEQMGTWQPVDCDLGDVDGREFLTMATVGFTARINARCNGLRVRGPWIYVAVAVQLLLGARPDPLTITLDGRTATVRAWMVSVANSRSQGAGVVVAPDADLHDGLLDVVVYDARTWPGFVVTLAATLLRRHHRGLRGVRYHRARRVVVDGSPSVDCYADGERLSTTPCVMTVRPRPARLLAPVGETGRTMR